MAEPELDFRKFGGVDEENAEENSKFVKFGGYHKTHIVFLLDLTHDMLLPSTYKDIQTGKFIPMAYACLVAIRQSVLEMIKLSSLGGGGRDRVALIGMMHKKNVVLLELQLPSAETIKKIDDLREAVAAATPKEGSKLDLGKALDMAFTFLHGTVRDAQIFVCTANDDPCEASLRRCYSEQAIVCSKAKDLAKNHDTSINLLIVPVKNREKPFDVNIFWKHVVSNQDWEERPTLSSMPDLIQQVQSLTRPQALAVPNGGFMKLTLPKAAGDDSPVVLTHVNLYALSRSRELHPTKTFRVDLDGGAFVTALRKTHQDGLDEEGSSDDEPDEPENSGGSRVLKFRKQDLKIWNKNEVAALTSHKTPKSIEVVGFIQNNRINREYRGNSPQYLTSAHAQQEDERKAWVALWHACHRLRVSCVAVIYRGARQAPKQALLTAHREVRDPHGRLRLPHGFYVHYLPYRERVYCEMRPKHTTENVRAGTLMNPLETMLNSISGAGFYPANNRNAIKQWTVLEALALNLDLPEPETSEASNQLRPEIAEAVQALQSALPIAVEEAPKAKRARKK